MKTIFLGLLAMMSLTVVAQEADVDATTGATRRKQKTHPRT